MATGITVGRWWQSSSGPQYGGVDTGHVAVGVRGELGQAGGRCRRAAASEQTQTN